MSFCDLYVYTFTKGENSRLSPCISSHGESRLLPREVFKIYELVGTMQENLSAPVQVFSCGSFDLQYFPEGWGEEQSMSECLNE